MVAPQDNTGPGSGGSPPVCTCGRGLAWFEAFTLPICLDCAANIYDLLGPYLGPDDWLAMAVEISRISVYPESAVPSTTLLAFLDQMTCVLRGVKQSR